MQCYTHHERAAVGTCKVCGKGLCPDCLADLGHSLACKGTHEALADDIAGVLQRSIQVQAAASRSVYVGPAFFAFIALMFLVFGVRDSSTNSVFFAVAGGALLVFATVLLALNRRAYAGTPGHQATPATVASRQEE